MLRKPTGSQPDSCARSSRWPIAWVHPPHQLCPFQHTCPTGSPASCLVPPPSHIISSSISTTKEIDSSSQLLLSLERERSRLAIPISLSITLYWLPHCGSVWPGPRHFLPVYHEAPRPGHLRISSAHHHHRRPPGGRPLSCTASGDILGLKANQCLSLSADSPAGREPAAYQRGAGAAGRLTQALNHDIQRSGGGSINPCILGIEVVCHSDDDRQQHGVQALSQEGDHLGEGLQCPLVHFLVGILKPWGESIEDLSRE